MNMPACTLFNEQNQEPMTMTTLLCSCNGVFTDRFIFRLNFPRMRLPQEPDDQLQEIKLTSYGHRTGTAFVF